RKGFKKPEVRDVKKNEPICYECKKPRHIKAECPKLKKTELKKKDSSKKFKRYKKKAMSATWDNSSDSDSESSSSEEEEEKANLAFMANIEEKLHSHISTKLKRSTRAWGIPRGTTEENKQLTTLNCWSCYYIAGGTDPAPLRRGSELDDGRETSSSLSPVGVRVSLASHWLSRELPQNRANQKPQSRSHGRKVQLPLHVKSQTTVETTQTPPPVDHTVTGPCLAPPETLARAR
ncbi:hypothetical protein Taro_022766, partial [Colocasia esculenta]|nr:hypothetical protein [Colocasia esculenta]